MSSDQGCEPLSLSLRNTCAHTQAVILMLGHCSYYMVLYLHYRPYYLTADDHFQFVVCVGVVGGGVLFVVG